MDRPPCVELGKPLNWCAAALKRQQIEGVILLPSEWWFGWQIRRGWLHGPGGMRFTPQVLAAVWRLSRLREHLARKGL
jgi:hypothetical protein